MDGSRVVVLTLSCYALLLGLPLTLATSPQGCNVSVVGAGWAGIYSAWRLAVDQPHVGRSICLFEAYNRPGGRTYTTRIDDYMVDVGAYRFALDMHLPADLISKALGFRTACYDPTCKDDDVKAEVKWPYKLPLSKIVGFDGRHLGYGAAFDTMLAQFENVGGRLFLGTELAAISQNKSSESWHLLFKKSGQEQTTLNISTRAVLLNLPRSVHEEISGLREAASSRWAALHCNARQFPSTVTEASTTTKVYAIYQDAWWVSKLGLLRGVRENVTTVPPISIHYHDGEVLCVEDGRDPGGAPRWLPARQASQLSTCRGVLQVFYRHNATCPSSFPQCMDYWTTLPRRNMSDPLTVVSQGAGSTPAGDKIRATVHKKLIEMHRIQLLASGLSEKDIVSLALPSSVVYSVWYHQGTFPVGDQRMLSGPQDIIFTAAEGIPAACGVESVTKYQDAVEGTGSWTDVAPGVHFVNNDFSATETSAWHGPWAEQSLLGAERMLAKAFGLKRPLWLNETYYHTKVLRETQPEMPMNFV